MTRGKFVSIEGPDGSGKTSVIRELSKELSKLGIDFMTTREPGGSPIAEQIREIILDTDNTAMDFRTEALLFAAQRRQHLVDRIIPALEADKLVITDRFVDSSMVYQGVARQIPLEMIWNINQFAIEGHLPEITLLIDVPAEVGLQRIHQAQGQRQYDRLDKESLVFHQMVREAFRNFAKEDKRFILIDGNQPIETVTKACLNALKEHQII